MSDDRDCEYVAPRVIASVIFIMLTTIGIFFLFGCTLCFQNVSTHGTADDLIDEVQTPNNDVRPKIQIPLNLKGAYAI